MELLSKIKSAFTVISVIAVIVLWSIFSYFAISYGVKIFSSLINTDSIETSTSPGTDNTEDCNVYGINLHGEIVTYNSRDAFDDQGNLIVDQTSADDAHLLIQDANDNENVKAVVVEIDSGGGLPVAGEEMMKVFKQSTKPVVAFIRNQGLSAAYLAATGAETIFASKMSDVGSIGVTMSYLEYAGQNIKEGLKFLDLSSGKYKDAGNPEKPLTAEEKQIFMRDIKLLHENFIQLVAQNRKLDINKVKALADGSSMLGEAALKNGLIDKIGSIDDVKNFIKEKIGEEPQICWQN